MVNRYYRNKSNNRNKHESANEYADASITPQHGPHGAGKPDVAYKQFPLPEYASEHGFCGTENLEVGGLYGFVHVRCPWASATPCSCGRQSLHLDSLVVAVDGACPGNGTPLATKSAYGVYFGPDSAANVVSRVPDTPGYAHTSQRAELSAAIAAIEASMIYIREGGQWECEGCPTPCPVRHLVIKSDSAYLVDGMTAHLEKWRANGWRTAKGTEVKNQDLWSRLDDKIRFIQQDKDVAINFWHVPRHHNTDADRLANLGLLRRIFT
ncbi:ribonuclease H-like protein [Hypoxylon argillaceum]|nr:ribonuclease H-like protein [Hypoxylon argillaceum]